MKKIVLLDDTGRMIVGTEYNENDRGRLLVLPDRRYGHFYADAMVFEFAKVAYEITEVVYCAAQWPPGVEEFYPRIIEAFSVKREGASDDSARDT